MPLINVNHASPLTEQQLDELISRLTETYTAVTGAKAESVQVLVHAVPAERWGIGGQSLAARRRS